MDLVEIKKALNPSQYARKARVLRRIARGPVDQRMVLAEQSRRAAMENTGPFGDRIPRAARKRGYGSDNYNLAIDGPPKGRQRLP